MQEVQAIRIGRIPAERIGTQYSESNYMDCRVMLYSSRPDSMAWMKINVKQTYWCWKDWI